MRLFVLLFALLAFSQCQETCKPAHDQVARVTFYDLSTKKAISDTMQIFNIQADGSTKRLFKDTTKANSTISLPLSPQSDEVTFQFFASNNKTYSCRLGYARQPEIGNPDCGIVVNYSDLRLLGQNFDSTAVISTIIDETSTTPNLVFYIRTK